MIFMIFDWKWKNRNFMEVGLVMTNIYFQFTRGIHMLYGNSHVLKCLKLIQTTYQQVIWWFSLIWFGLVELRFWRNDTQDVFMSKRLRFFNKKAKWTVIGLNGRSQIKVDGPGQGVLAQNEQSWPMIHGRTWTYIGQIGRSYVKVDGLRQKWTLIGQRDRSWGKLNDNKWKWTVQIRLKVEDSLWKCMVVKFKSERSKRDGNFSKLYLSPGHIRKCPVILNLSML